MNEEDWYFYDEAKRLSRLIKEYVDCPVNELLTHKFNDRFKLISILHVCDRRIGKDAWNNCCIMMSIRRYHG